MLLNESAAHTIGVFDADTFIDYRARRPVMELREGVNSKMIWPSIEVRLGRDVAGHDVLLLTGHEPDSAWHLFCSATTEIALDLGVRMVVGLGAYPYGAPHTRPSRLSITAGSAELAASLPYLKNSVDVPAGVGAALEERFTEVGVPAVGLWAQVPHYVANLPYPGASVALLRATLLLGEDVGAVADVQGADALGPLELVGTQRDEVGAEGLHVDVDV